MLSALSQQVHWNILWRGTNIEPYSKCYPANTMCSPDSTCAAALRTCLKDKGAYEPWKYVQ